MSVGSGKSFPLGASIQQGGVNFSLFSEHATAVRLLLFDRADDGRPARTIELDPRRQRTYHYWHAFVPGLQAGQLYAWRVDGPRRPDLGLRFDPDKVLLDPYGRAVAVPAAYDRAAASRPGDNAAVAGQERGGRLRRLRLGGRSAALPAVLEHRDLRDARARLHPPPEFRRRRARSAAPMPG